MGPSAAENTTKAARVTHTKLDASGLPAVCAGRPADLIRQLDVYVRLLDLYPPGHDRVRQHAAQVAALLNRLLPAGGDAILLEAGDTLSANGVKIENAAAAQRIAHLFRERGIRALRLDPGMGEAEFRMLADLLRISYKALLCCGGIESFLSGRDHPHLEIGAARTGPVRVERTPAQEEAPAPVQEEPAPVQEAPVGGSAEEAEGDADVLPKEETREFDFPSDPGSDMTLDRVAYSIGEADALKKAPVRLVEAARAGLRDEIDSSDPELIALMTLAELLPVATDLEQYRTRRELLLRALVRNTIGSAIVRTVVLNLVANLKQSRFEDAETFLFEILATARDDQLVRDVLALRELTLHAARTVAQDLTLRPEAFTLLSFLARAPLADRVRGIMLDAFLAAIRRRPVPFRHWVMHNREVCLHPEVLDSLISEVPGCLAPVVKEIFRGGSESERRRLIHRLVEHGGENAVRLLPFGMKYGAESRTLELIEAFGHFDHPIAVAMLREVIHRCNTRSGDDLSEAEAAIRALRDSESEDARSFLWEVYNSRRLFLPLFRRRLRGLAEQALSGLVLGAA